MFIQELFQHNIHQSLYFAHINLFRKFITDHSNSIIIQSPPNNVLYQVWINMRIISII